MSWKEFTELIWNQSGQPRGPSLFLFPFDNAGQLLTSAMKVERSKVFLPRTDPNHLGKPVMSTPPFEKPFDDLPPNFTPRAQQVLATARLEAHRLNHNFVGTEHLLLG